MVKTDGVDRFHQHPTLLGSTFHSVTLDRFDFYLMFEDHIILHMRSSSSPVFSSRDSV